MMITCIRASIQTSKEELPPATFSPLARLVKLDTAFTRAPIFSGTSGVAFSSELVDSEKTLGPSLAGNWEVEG